MENSPPSRLAWLAVVLVSVLGAAPSRACVGAACLQIWSTADGGGALAIQYDFTRKVQTVLAFPNPCTAADPMCLYTTIDPGFMAPTTDSDPSDSYFVLHDATVVNLVIVAADAGPGAADQRPEALPAGGHGAARDHADDPQSPVVAGRRSRRRSTATSPSRTS